MKKKKKTSVQSDSNGKDLKSFIFSACKFIFKNLLIQWHYAMSHENKISYIIFFSRYFQPIVFAPDDTSLSSDQDIDQFLV